MYPEPVDTNRPVPPVRAEFAGNPQEEELIPKVPPRMDKHEEHDTITPHHVIKISINEFYYRIKKLTTL